MKKLLSLVLALMLLCGASAMAEMAGGWTIPEDVHMTEEAFEVFYDAMGYDAGLWPQCLMATQVVAGVNYAVLSAGVDDVEIVYVYHSVSGDNEVLRRQVLVAYDAQLAGGWSRLGEDEPGEEGFQVLSASLDHLEGLHTGEYFILAKQLVAGTNYLVLCHVTTLDDDPVGSWVMATVYVDLENHSSVTDLREMVLSATGE